MTLSYRNTYADYREAQRGYAAARPTRRMWVVLGIALAILAAAVTLWSGRPAGPRWDGLRALARLALLMAAFPLYMLTVLRLPVGRSAGAFADVSRRIGRFRGLFAANLGVLFAIALACLLPPPAAAGTTTPGEFAVLWLVPTFPLAVAVAAAALVVRVVRRRTFRAQPHLQRERTAEVTPDDATFDNGLVRTTYRPLAIVRVIETPRLFLLCPSFVTFEIMPKRAFASAEQLGEFRTVALVWASTRTNAFPVVAVPDA